MEVNRECIKVVKLCVDVVINPDAVTVRVADASL
jgi:hypothetical protein